jgi:hypothetical protein
VSPTKVISEEKKLCSVSRYTIPEFSNGGGGRVGKGMLKGQWKSFLGGLKLEFKGHYFEIQVICTVLTDEGNKTQQF